jgi:ABC-2 type transport system permease protein
VRISGARVGRMARKELRQMLRDVRMRMVIFAAPVIQLVVFGYAVSTDVREVPAYVVDHDRTAASRALVDRMTAGAYFTLAGQSERSADLVRALERGDALVGVEIPAGYSVDLAAGRGPPVQVLVDGTDSNRGSIALGYVLRMLQQAADGVPAGISLTARAWYNPDLESRVYNVPAVMGLLLLLITMLLTSLSVVREREIGTWDQLVVSPISPVELLLGKTLPVALVGFVVLVLVSTVAVFWFGIPIRGPVLALLFAAVPYLLAGLALGLLVSTVSKTQQEAFMTMFLILMPALIFSGTLFPVSSMPEPFQWVTQFNPVKHFIVVVRGVFLKGTGFADHVPEYGALWTMAVLGLGVGVRRFRQMTG